MLTEAQYIFLEDFINTTKDCKMNDNNLGACNCEKISADMLKKIFERHPSLYPAEPYSDTNPDDSLDGELLRELIVSYLEKSKLKDCIDLFEQNMYGISSEGIRKIEFYKREKQQTEQVKKSNSIARRANLISLVAVIISVLALILPFLISRCGGH